MTYGCQSMVGRIERVLVKHSREAFVDAERVRTEWAALDYAGCPDYDRASQEYERFLEVLKAHVPIVEFLPRDDRVSLDSIYVHDPVIITKRGAILCSMTRPQRQPEPAAVADALPGLGIPIWGAIKGDGRLESGDVVWLNERTIAVGRGRRTNDEGIRQLKEMLSGVVDDVHVVDLPPPIFHLMGIISLIDEDLAVVNSEFLPASFREQLRQMGFRLLEVARSEFKTLACNILTIAPRKCLVISGNPVTTQLLKDEGVDVTEYSGEEISLKGCGGPACLTRPILRA